MPSIALGGGGAVTLTLSGPPVEITAALRGGGGLIWSLVTTADLAANLDGGGTILVGQRPPGDLAATLVGGGTISMATLAPVRGAFALDGGGAINFGQPSAWSLDIDNSGTNPSDVFPDLEFQLSTAAATGIPNWVAVAARVLGFTTNCGRSGEFDDFPAGTGTITLDNQGGYFDRDNAASPIAPYLTTTRRVRIVATWAAVAYVVFDQFVDFWPMDDDPTFEARTVTVTTTDAFGLLANLEIAPARPFTLDDPVLGVLDAGNVLGGQPSFDATLSGERIREILRLVGWPDELTDIDSGVTPIVADSPTDKVLPVIQQCARSEMGLLFVAAGVVTYRQRRAWARIDEQRTPQIVFTDNPELLPGVGYSALDIDPGSKALIKNKVTRTTKSGMTFTAMSIASQAQFGVIEDEQDDLLTANYAEVAGQCQYVVARYADAVPRITGLTADAVDDPAAIFPFILGGQIGWRATAVRTPAINGTPVARDVTVEAIAHTVVAPLSWETTWQFVEADETPYFTLDDPILGRLDAGNRFAF